MAEELVFETRADFREWLTKNAATSGGVWLVFGKAGGPKTLSYQEALEERGLMTELGRARIEEAKKNGQWDAAPPAKITDEQVGMLTQALESCEPAYTNFIAMPPSVKRTYTGLYFSAKTEQTRKKYLDKIIGRLNKNLKPM